MERVGKIKIDKEKDKIVITGLKEHQFLSERLFEIINTTIELYFDLEVDKLERQKDKGLE